MVLRRFFRSFIAFVCDGCTCTLVQLDNSHELE